MSEAVKRGFYVVQVQADKSGEWVGNGLEFNRLDRAEAYGADLAARWTMVRAWRVVVVYVGGRRRVLRTVKL